MAMIKQPEQREMRQSVIDMFCRLGHYDELSLNSTRLSGASGSVFLCFRCEKLKLKFCTQNSSAWWEDKWKRLSHSTVFTLKSITVMFRGFPQRAIKDFLNGPKLVTLIHSHQCHSCLFLRLTSMTVQEVRPEISGDPQLPLLVCEF